MCKQGLLCRRQVSRVGNVWTVGCRCRVWEMCGQWVVAVVCGKCVDSGLSLSCVGNVWTLCGVAVVCGKCVDFVWCRCRVWEMCGLCVVSLSCVGNVWTLCGVAVGVWEMVWTCCGVSLSCVGNVWTLCGVAVVCGKCVDFVRCRCRVWEMCGLCAVSLSCVGNVWTLCGVAVVCGKCVDFVRCRCRVWEMCGLCRCEAFLAYMGKILVPVSRLQGIGVFQNCVVHYYNIQSPMQAIVKSLELNFSSFRKNLINSSIVEYPVYANQSRFEAYQVFPEKPSNW
ncbi:hypothetical protein HNY73_012896 [Argiope bruennichi]|uniref:Uncharacterized protein n=1 Tax=Argiope bruennichi TaxID=94029 RepID=A0A8T0F278_ARGBR|nr:hypothetical protein HNY73_012896 [Argiope bruennichi]